MIGVGRFTASKREAREVARRMRRCGAVEVRIEGSSGWYRVRGMLPSIGKWKRFWSYEQRRDERKHDTERSSPAT